MKVFSLRENKSNRISRRKRLRNTSQTLITQGILEFFELTNVTQLPTGLSAKHIASPLFNTATPYINFGSNNTLICLGAYDPARWETAAKCAVDAIIYHESNGYAIVNTPNTKLPWI